MVKRRFSIKEYATHRARKLAIRISIVGFVFSTFILIAASFFAYYMRLDFAAKAVESSIASSMQTGDIPQLNRTMGSIGKSDRIETARVFSNAGNLIATNKEFVSGEKLFNPGEMGFAVRGNLLQPRLSFRIPINYGFEKPGTFELIASIPIGLLVLSILGIAFIFFVGSIVVISASQKTALAIAQPASDLAKQLRAATDSFTNVGPINSDYDFAEIQQVREEFSSLFKRFEESQEKERIAQREALAGRIATKVRHDVKQALFASDAVLKRLTGNPEHLEIMRAALRRIEETVEEIPKFSNSPNLQTFKSKNAENLERVSIVEIVSPVFREFSAIINTESRSIDMGFDYNETIGGVQVDVDTAKFHRMMANLLANSIDAMSGRGTLKVQIQILDRDNVTVFVKDSGKGIPLKVLPSIGKHGFSYGKPNGSGLGLSSAIEYVNSWKGNIQISSEEGSGTVVSVTLPIKGIKALERDKRFALVKSETKEVAFKA